MLSRRKNSSSKHFSMILLWALLASLLPGSSAEFFHYSSLQAAESDTPSMTPSLAPVEATDNSEAAPRQETTVPRQATTSPSPSLVPVGSAPSTPGAPVVASMAPSDQPSDMPSYMPSDVPSDMPSSAPTTSAAPSSNPTASPAPTTSPSLAPTYSMVPSVSPTMPFIPVSGELLVVLERVPRLMDASVEAKYLTDLTDFFTDKIPGIIDLVVKLDDQTLEGSPEVRRRLQQNFPLTTELSLEAKSPGVDMDLGAVAKDVLDIPTNEVELIDMLQEANSTEVEAYFRAIINLRTTPLPSPTPAPAEDDALSTGAIVGIVVAAGVALVIVAGVGFVMLHGDSSKDDSLAGADEESSAPPQRQSATPSQPVEPAPVSISAMSSGMSVDEESNMDFDAPSLASQTYDQDQMSYAYSLDAAGVDTVAGGTAGGGSVAGRSQVSELSEGTPGMMRANTVTRKVQAPAGKLGIVIDTTLEGPVVHKVNSKSPLEGLVFPGDIIIAINNVDTRAMSASAITALMVKTANQTRTLTVISDDISQM